MVYYLHFTDKAAGLLRGEHSRPVVCGQYARAGLQLQAWSPEPMLFMSVPGVSMRTWHAGVQKERSYLVFAHLGKVAGEVRILIIT